ncbi:MAG: hypothetical protein WCR98_05375 [Saccharofermentanales bacterium]
MSQSRDPQRKGKDSKVKTQSKNQSRNLMAQKGGTKPSASAKNAKPSPQESPQVVEMRRKVNLVYLLILATCGVVIVVFALLVANKLSTAGIIADPEESGLLQATLPGETKIGETATGTITTPISTELETGETDPTESDASDASGTTSKTAPVKVGGPVTRRTYSYGNVNIEGGLNVVTTTTTPTTNDSDNEDGEGDTDATDPAEVEPTSDPNSTKPPAATNSSSDSPAPPVTGGDSAGGGDDGSSGGGDDNSSGGGDDGSSGGDSAGGGDDGGAAGGSENDDGSGE